MASSRGYLDFIPEQLSGLEDISYRAMMGEYIIYYKGKIVGGIYDDRFLVKSVPAAKRLMPEALYKRPTREQRKCSLRITWTIRTFCADCSKLCSMNCPLLSKK